MRIHALVHRKPGVRFNFEDAFDAEGIRYDSGSFRYGDVPPRAEDLDALLVFGGAMGAMEEADHPWLLPEMRWIESVMRSGKPVLGVCLGGQLLSRIMGARVYRNPDGPEFGFWTASLTERGRVSPLFAGFPERFPVFEWHSDVFDLPEGAILLATGAYWRNQAWSCGDSVFALQFHLEFTRSNLEEFLGADGDAAPRPSRSAQDPTAALSNRRGFADTKDAFLRMLSSLGGLSGIDGKPSRA